MRLFSWDARFQPTPLSGIFAHDLEASGMELAPNPRVWPELIRQAGVTNQPLCLLPDDDGSWEKAWKDEPETHALVFVNTNKLRGFKHFRDINRGKSPRIDLNWPRLNAYEMRARKGSRGQALCHVIPGDVLRYGEAFFVYWDGSNWGQFLVPEESSR